MYKEKGYPLSIDDKRTSKRHFHFCTFEFNQMYTEKGTPFSIEDKRTSKSVRPDKGKTQHTSTREK